MELPTCVLRDLLASLVSCRVTRIMKRTNKGPSVFVRVLPVLQWASFAMFGSIWVLSVGDVLSGLGWQPLPVLPAAVLTLTSGVWAAVVWRTRTATDGDPSHLLVRLHMVPKWFAVSVLSGAVVLHFGGFVYAWPSVQLAGLGLMGLGFFWISDRTRSEYSSSSRVS